MDTSSEFIFDDYFNDINLNNELKKFYEIINDDELDQNLDEAIKLTDLKNENYKRYNDINLLLLDNLLPEFENIVKEIKKIYAFIEPNELLQSDIDKALENKKIINNIYYFLERLEQMVEKESSILEKENDERQSKIKNIDYSSVDKNLLQEMLNKYNDIILFNSTIEEDIYKNYNKQIKRKKYLNDLYKLINLEIEIKTQKIEEKEKLNIEINKKIKEINANILYLEDLMMEKSKYEKEFIIFKNYINELIAYDDKNYTDLNRAYYNLCEDLKIKSALNYFEDAFIKEIEKAKEEEKFIYEKSGIKNLTISLNYIVANYMDLLDNCEKEIINNLYDVINNNNYNISNIYGEFKRVVNNIWKKSITDIYSYNQNDDFCFICSNNQFIDEKHEAILITKKMLERTNNSLNYQIGFVCNFNDNILYITENDDIMTVNYNDLSNLKTPKQIEQEFINFRVYNKIALNGYITKINAVYFIDDGNSIKYKKAVELSNQYKLPLITIKKDKN